MTINKIPWASLAKLIAWLSSSVGQGHSSKQRDVSSVTKQADLWVVHSCPALTERQACVISFTVTWHVKCLRLCRRQWLMILPWYVVLGIFTLIGQTTKQKHLVSCQSEAVPCTHIAIITIIIIIVHKNTDLMCRKQQLKDTAQRVSTLSSVTMSKRSHSAL